MSHTYKRRRKTIFTTPPYYFTVSTALMLVTVASDVDVRGPASPAADAFACGNTFSKPNFR